MDKMEEIITNNGSFLCINYDSIYKIYLYLLDKVYYELWVDKKNGKLLHIRNFSDIKNLDPYLEHLNLDTLFGC